MNEIERKLEFCYEQIREKTDFVPEVALILGSGLGELCLLYTSPSPRDS